MLKGFNENGELKNVMVTEDGAVKVAMQGGGGGSQEAEIINTVENPVPVSVIGGAQEVETTLKADVLTVGTTAETIAIGKKVTEVDVANYSETADITITINNKDMVIGSNVATTLTINADVTSIDVESTEADTKVQIVVKGVV